MNATRRELLFVTAFLTAMALIFTWPLAARLTQVIPGDETANGGVQVVGGLQGLYILTWGIHALANHPLQFFHANVFYPHSETLAYGDHLFGIAFTMAPLQWILANPILTYNVAVLLTFIVGGLGAYALARHLTGSAPGGLLAALIYAFSGFRFHHIGSLNVLALHWIPWLFLIGHIYLEERHRRMIYIGAFFAAVQVLTCSYSLYFLFVGVGLALVTMLYRRRSGLAPFLHRHRYHYAVAATLSLLVVYPFYHPYLSHSAEQASFHRGTSDIAGSSADVSDLLNADGGSLLGPLLDGHAPDRPPLFPGVAALVLLAFLLLQWRRRRQVDDHRLHYYALLGLTAGLLAFGPKLTVAGRPSEIPLPYLAAYEFVPGWWGMHVPVRFWALASLALAILAAMAYRRLEIWAAPLPKGPTIVGALLVVTAAELYPGPLPTKRVLPRSGPPLVYRWLESTDPEEVVADIPASAPDGPATVRDAMRQFYSVYHWHRVVDGVSGFTPPLTRAFRERMRNFPDDRSLAQLRVLHVDHIVVHFDELGDARAQAAMEERILDQPGLIFEGRFGNDRVFTLAGTGPTGTE